MKKYLLPLILILFIPSLVGAVIFTQNQLLISPATGLIVSTTTSSGGMLQASSSPAVSSFDVTGTFTNATSTSGCAQYSSTGILFSTGAVCTTSASGSPFNFTKTSYGVSTSTTVGFTNGLMSLASSTINANLFLSLLSNGGLYIGTNGQVFSAATTTAGTGLTYSGNAFNVNTSQNISTLSNLSSLGLVTNNSSGTLFDTASSSLDLPNSALQSSSVTVNTSGCLNGGGSLSLGSSLSLTSTCDTFAYPFPNNATTTTLTFTNASTTAISISSSLSINGNATTTSIGNFSTNGVLTISGTTSTSTFSNGIQVTGGCFELGSTCINGTVTSVGLSDANSTLTIGSTPVTTSGTITATLNLAHANTWSALQSFANASSTTLSAGDLAVGQTATTTIDRAGNLVVAGNTTMTSATTTIGEFNNNLLANQASFGQTATTTLNTTGAVQFTPSQPATSTSMVLNWATSPEQVEYQIGTSNTTITLTNATTTAQWGSIRRVLVCNPGSTAGALTWVGVEWGTAPTQTTTASQCDEYVFNIVHATSTSAYKVLGSQAVTAFP